MSVPRLSSAVPHARCASKESRSSGLELKAGGRFHLKLDIYSIPMANKSLFRSGWDALAWCYGGRRPLDCRVLLPQFVLKGIASVTTIYFQAMSEPQREIGSDLSKFTNVFAVTVVAYVV